MSYTQRFTEGMELLGVLNPASQTVVQDTGNLLTENVHRGVAIIHVGVMAGTATLDADLEQASDTTAGTRKAITGKSITQLTQAGGDGDQVVVIEWRAEELDVDGGFEYVNLEVTPASAAVIFGAQVWGVVQRFKPVSTTNIEEIVD